MTIVLPESFLASGRTFRSLQDEALSDDFTDRAFMKEAINDALADIARTTHLPLLEKTTTITTAAGTAAYTLTSDRVRLLAVVDGAQNRLLDEVEITWIDEAGDASGRPQVFAEYGSNATFWPTPDGVYSLTVRYSSKSATLTSDSANVTSVIPDQYAYMVVSFARARAFAREDDVQMAQFWRGEYERDLLRLKGDVGRRSAGRVRRVPGMWQAERPVTFQRP
jgi:hypothetical protein